MKSDHEILIDIIRTHFAGNQSRAAEAFKTPAPHINQIVHGKKNLGYAVARRIEDAVGKKHLFTITSDLDSGAGASPFEKELTAALLVVKRVAMETGVSHIVAGQVAAALLSRK